MKRKLGRYHEATREFQRGLVLETLYRAGGSVTGAARDLELGREQLHNLMRRLGIREAARENERARREGQAEIRARACDWRLVIGDFRLRIQGTDGD